MTLAAVLLLTTAAQKTLTNFPTPGHYAHDCNIGSGFDWERGCLESAVVRPDDCKHTDNDDAPCVDQEDIFSEKWYRTVIDAQPSILFTSIAEGEGYGWGSLLSISGKTQLDSEMSDNSVTLIMGKGKTLFRRFINDNDNMVLTNEATDKLIEDPVEFLKIYGRYYVKEVHYGGSYLGFHNIAKAKYDSTNETEVFTKYDVNDVFFTRGTSNNFTHTAYSAILRREVNWTHHEVYHGGPQPTGANANMDPFEMGRRFQ